ncbi:MULTISPECIES: tyrosine-type recombinase/integrase [unclassified Serratia (in: enterobacteria)]|uniref:tyrosine-type recombinase/integrase n=1 Tax=unclassified Serratia (in: enterobacteria) TaxID=2647522 RepID=UPI00068DEFE5|nr:MULTISPECIES: tyrosine-type recombinase/integrase [unclassified Serratia (in: enterobacteria)]
MAHLTDLTIRRAKAARKPYTFKDGGGLYLNINSNGTKNWLFRFYWQGRQKRISFGTYPTVDLKKARSLRQQAHDLLANGIDPRTYRASQSAPTQPNRAVHPSTTSQPPQTETIGIRFADYAEHWKAFKLKRLGIANRRQSTAIQIERYMRLDMLPLLGKLPLHTITRQHVLAVQRKIEKRGALSIAEKVRSWLNELFRHAIAEGHIDTNPAADLDIIALPQKPTLHNPFLRIQELPAFLHHLHHYQGSRQTQLGLKLLLLTGVRTGELRQARPEHIDLKHALWKIPAETVKQLQKRVRTSSTEIPPYLVPLSRQAVQVIRELLDMRFASQHYLFSHRSEPKLPISENTLNSGLRRMGYKDRLTGHGIRATLSTALNELGYPKEWIEAQLSHSDKDQVRAAYNHAEYVEQRRQMMQEWADRLDQWREQASKPQNPPITDELSQRRVKGGRQTGVAHP